MKEHLQSMRTVVDIRRIFLYTMFQKKAVYSVWMQLAIKTITTGTIQTIMLRKDLTVTCLKPAVTSILMEMRMMVEEILMEPTGVRNISAQENH